MTSNNIFTYSEFDNRLNRLKASIEKYLNKVDYDLGDLEIDFLHGQLAANS